MFTQDHKADFDAVLAAKKPFAFVRFGDGETAIIDGVGHRSADHWSSEGDVWLKTELYESLQTRLDSFCLGLPPACCGSRGLKLRAAVALPTRMQTFATLFMHVNLSRAHELRKRFDNALLIHHEYGDFKIPADGVTQPWDVAGVVEQMLAVRDRPILMAAGPCSNILALRYWKQQDKELRVPIIDLGSTLDVMHGHINRWWHGKMNDHTCSWHEADRGNRRVGKPTIRIVAESRIRLGRATQSKDVKKIQRVQQRKRIGKR